ncbi:MAG: hypothetical protein LBM93_06590 [Oscillospiraceae bacterium]|jgi:hypothetical protein|nr:hypothetical protein [Oscillospiraceae bacterium]
MYGGRLTAMYRPNYIVSDCQEFDKEEPHNIFVQIIGNMVQHIYTIDLSDFIWDMTGFPASALTAGTYAKCKHGDVYYKLSQFDGVGFYTYASYFEEVAYRLGVVLGINVLKQVSGTALVTLNNEKYVIPVCISKDYGEGVQSRCFLEDACGADAISWTKRNGLWEDIQGAFVLDYIINNRDRHEHNFEILEYAEGYRLAPLFDNGLSFSVSFCNDNFTLLSRNKPTNNFIGSKFLEDNLDLVEKKYTFSENKLYWITECLPLTIQNPVLRYISEAINVLAKRKIIEVK